tara:strand:- start:1762 stop:3159 length:1398 start_codon:yes stop_codon:yes gene_type:complete
MKINLAKSEIIHFVGIGGIGMSGLALIMKDLGFQVQGSDILINKNIKRLKKNKIKVFLGHDRTNIKKATILVISSAIKFNNIEFKQAKKKNLPIYKRGDVLAHIVALKKNIVISGSHGKTTTTSLVGSILSNANLDPTIINGGVINSFDNSAKLGKSEWSVVESDESDGSFVKLPSTYAIVTNIDREHMDYYKSLVDLKKHFINFMLKVPSFGKTFLCIDDKYNCEILKTIKIKNVLTYGQNKKSNFRITNIFYSINQSKFDLKINLPNKKTVKLSNIKISMIGIHNIRNAAAAIAVSYFIGVSPSIIKQSLKNFKGVERRFNKVFNFEGINFYDDYAHHPTEIKCVVNSVKQSFKNKKITCIFQPHRISRLNDLKNHFTKAFKNADTVILCPIYKAGENIKISFDYTNFAKKISKDSNVKVLMAENKFEIANYFKKNINLHETVIGMGAGSVSNWIRDLPKLLK